MSVAIYGEFRTLKIQTSQARASKPAHCAHLTRPTFLAYRKTVAWCQAALSSSARNFCHSESSTSSTLAVCADVGHDEAKEGLHNEGCETVIILLTKTRQPLFELPGDANLVPALSILFSAYINSMKMAEIQTDMFACKLVSSAPHSQDWPHAK